MSDFDPLRAYNDLPKLPPSAKLESTIVLRYCIEARAALAQLKASENLIPNQGVLINSIPLLEAKDSSEIENIVTTADSLFQSVSDKFNLSNHATKEAIRYRTALLMGFKSLANRPLTTATAIEVCSAIKGVEFGIRRVPGTALKNSKTNEVIYTPPEGEALIRDCMSNWEKFLHEDSGLDPVIKMAVGHYQFEAIHPFTDGNGRTGRILNLLYLIDSGLLTQPVMYLSRYILQHKSDYYQLLLDVTKYSNWEPWLLFMLAGVTETAIWTSQKIVAIKRLMDHTVSFVQKRLPKVYSRELVECIFTQPYCRIANLLELAIAKRETASSYLKLLCEIGILEERKVGRDKVFIHPKFVGLLVSDSQTFTDYD